MKRLTKRNPDWPAWPLLDRPRGALCTAKFCTLSDRCDHIGDRTCPYIQRVDRLAAIEDILGDEYELEQIGKVVHCKDCMHMWAEAEFPGECYCRMLGEVVPFDGFCHKGEAALKAREQDEQ